MASGLGPANWLSNPPCTPPTVFCDVQLRPAMGRNGSAVPSGRKGSRFVGGSHGERRLFAPRT